MAQHENRATSAMPHPSRSLSHPTSRSPLLTSLQEARNGLSLADLQALHPALPRRTVQRWIAHLLTEGQAWAEGRARARRYFASSGALQVRESASHAPPLPPLIKVLREVDDSTWDSGNPTPASAPSHETQPPSALVGSRPGIAVSIDSEDILDYVSQPLQARHPVSYQRDLLDRYEPNQTAYLSESLRRQLRQIGQTPHAAQPAGTFSRAILNRLLIDLSWASSHLEGNTYSRLDTRHLIEHGQAAQGKSAHQTQMILNHKAAIELLVENIDTVGFDRYTLMNVHAELAENLLGDPLDEGRVREEAVFIGQSVYRPLMVAAQINDALNEILDKASRIQDPFEQSFFTMVHLPYLQPFIDANKRTSRLMANLPLFRANLCPLTFLGVPQEAYTLAMLGVYEMARVELLRDLYVWAYGRSAQEYLAIQQAMVEPDPLRLAWRLLIRQTMREIVLHAEQDPMDIILRAVHAEVPAADQDAVKALIIAELRHLHEGVLARYRLRPSEYAQWRAVRRLRTLPG